MIDFAVPGTGMQVYQGIDPKRFFGKLIIGNGGQQ